MNADEVRAWLVAQIDADERVAQEAGGGRWRWDHGYGAMCNDKGCPYGELVSEDGAAGAVLMDVHGYDVREGWQGAEHIARLDPARVLRDVEAKRRRLERHAPEPWKPGWPGHVCHDFELINVPDGWTGPMTHWCDWCSETQSREEWFYAPWPCPDVIDDAQSYRDAPGFPAELRLP